MFFNATLLALKDVDDWTNLFIPGSILNALTPNKATVAAINSPDIWFVAKTAVDKHKIKIAPISMIVLGIVDKKLMILVEF